MSKNTQKKTENKGPVLTKQEIEAQKAADAITDIESNEYKAALRAESRSLLQNLTQEKTLLNQYQAEREKINYDWIILKKKLEDLRSEIINKNRELQDTKENHIMALNGYKQKIKHLLFQNQDQQSELRKDNEITMKQLEDEHTTQGRDLKNDNRQLKVIKKEQEVSQEDYLFAIRQDHARKMTQARHDFERMANDIKRKYEEKMKKLRSEMENARDQIIQKLEQKKDAKIQQIVREHTKKYTDIKNYYSDITATNLDLIKQLKNEINEHQKNEERDKKLLQNIEREQQSLKNPLDQLKAEIAQYELESKEQDRVLLEKDKITQINFQLEHQYRKLEYEWEVKLQNFKYLQRERDSLYERFNQTVYEIQQKTGLENLILQKQVSTIKDDLELKDLQLYQTLQAANLDPRTLGNIQQSLDEVEASKTELINELQQQLKQIRKAHSTMVKAYEGKLAEFVIPVEELGFDPLVPTNTD